MKEARRRQRRRRTRALVLLGVAALAVAAVASVWSRSGARSPSADAMRAVGVLPTGSLAVLHIAGALAVAPDGALYVTDVVGSGSAGGGGNRILVRLPDGRFRAVAGDGRVGFAGDGGPAIDAALSDVTDLVFAPDGALYIADGGRVRVVGRDGVIHTIAGDGKSLQTIANGTAALSASLGSVRAPVALSLAISPRSGQLYISTGRQILRLTAAGDLDTVRAVVTSGRDKGPLSGFAAIAIDAQGEIDVSGDSAGWAVWQVAPDGVAHLASPGQISQGNGGAYAILQPGPGGAIYGACPGIFRVEPHRLVSVAALSTPLSQPHHDPAFSPFYFTFSPTGTLYTDNETRGYTFLKPRYALLGRQQLLSISNGRASVLWQHTPK
jgi:hypothetical protein